MVWTMKRKRNPIGKIIKWKACLCAGGHCSIKFVDYWNTYSPIVSWQTIHLVFTLAIVNNWHIHSIDFVMAFPQADVRTDIYMIPPKSPMIFISQISPSLFIVSLIHINYLKFYMASRMLVALGNIISRPVSSSVDGFNPQLMSAYSLKKVSFLYSMWMMLVSSLLLNRKFYKKTLLLRRIMP